MDKGKSRALYYIILFTSSKNHLNDENIKSFLYDYLDIRSKSIGCDILKIGGNDESVHFAISIPPTISLSDVICILKSSSQNYIHKNFKHYNFFWKNDFYYKTFSEENLNEILSKIDSYNILNKIQITSTYS